MHKTSVICKQIDVEDNSGKVIDITGETGGDQNGTLGNARHISSERGSDEIENTLLEVDQMGNDDSRLEGLSTSQKACSQFVLMAWMSNGIGCLGRVKKKKSNMFLVMPARIHVLGQSCILE